MEITVRELDEQNLSDVGRCDGEFVVDSRLVLHVEDGEIAYSTVPVPRYRKRYPPEDVDPAAFLVDLRKTIFLAYVEGQIAGQIILRESWNRFACVQDIAVDAGFRRMGVGMALMDRAVEWSRQQGLPGLMLETQDNNVGACRFYERCGLQIGGFDRFLYQGLDPGSGEVALYWYRIFDDEEG